MDVMGTNQTLPFLKFAAAGVLKLHPYQPGMPVEELQRRLGVKDAIKLASNENPLGVSPRVKAALLEAVQGNLALYPDDGGFALKGKLAALHRVGPDSITLCNGSNTLLDLLARVFAGPGRAVMYSQYAFAVYPIVTLAQGAEAVVVPALPADSDMPYGDDLDGFLARLRPDVALIYLASPNNPTGTWVAPEDFQRFMAKVPPETVVVLDEAYHEFQAPELRPDIRSLQERHPNLVCLSALLTVTMPSMKTTIDALKSAGLRDQVRVLVGGAPVTEQWAKEIGADGYGSNAAAAVPLARSVLATM